MNGPRTRAEHKRVPITPDELARDANEVIGAGAAAVHLHPRLPDGNETLEAKSCGQTIIAIRETRRVPLGVSTASWIEKNPARKVSFIDGWKVNPDFASVNLNEEGWRDVSKALIRRGIWIEAGLWSVGDARTFVSSGIEEGCIRILVEITEKKPADAVSMANEMDELLTGAKVRLPILHHGYGLTTWEVLENALRLGRDIRVGLEDTLLLPDGNLADSNAPLVRAAVAMVKERGLLPMRLA